MGMNESSASSGGKLVFLTPINVEGEGPRWARRVTPDTEGAKARDAKCGLVHELYYESVSGMIESVRIVNKGEYGELLEITVSDDDMNMILSTPFNGDLGKGFIVRMEEVNKDVEAEIGIFGKQQGERLKRFCCISQEGQSLKHKYVKDGSKSLPEPVKKEKARGKVEWDWDAHDNALYEICKEVSLANGWAPDEEQFTEEFFKSSQVKNEAGPADTDPSEQFDDEPF